MKKVLVCIDGSELTKSVCDYGVSLAKKLQLPLVLLHVIERSRLVKTQDLSGNIGLGTTEELLEQYVNEEMSESKASISQAKTLMQSMREYIQKEGIEELETLLRHGTLQETLEDLSQETKIVIMGLRGRDRAIIGEHIEDLIRATTIPILLVNSEYEPIESILMAYDGSEFASKAIEVALQNPIFPDTKRYVVNVNKDDAESRRVLGKAKNLFGNAHYEIITQTLSGDGVESLLEYQEKNSISIIAMGAYSKGRLKNMIFGSFTKKMFLNAKKPLLLFR